MPDAYHHRSRGRKAAVVLLVAASTLLLGGCPIDTTALVTDVVAAALQSASNSFVEALSVFLAQP